MPGRFNIAFSTALIIASMPVHANEALPQISLDVPVLEADAGVMWATTFRCWELSKALNVVFGENTSNAVLGYDEEFIGLYPALGSTAFARSEIDEYTRKYAILDAQSVYSGCLKNVALSDVTQDGHCASTDIAVCKDVITWVNAQ